MCRIDDCPPWEVYRDHHPVARLEHRCEECGRTIRVGERYWRIQGRVEGEWLARSICPHCEAAAEAMRVWCGGWVFGYLLTEMTDHWLDGFASIPIGRLIVGVRLRWHDGRDPVPQAEAVAELAREAMR